MKTIKYTFAILFLSASLISCEADTIAEDDVEMETTFGTDIQRQSQPM